MSLDFLLSIFSSSVICPVAVLYMLALSDQWRIHLPGKLALLGGAAAIGLLFAWGLPVSMPIPILCSWISVLLPTIFCSRMKDSRFFFIFFSGILFAYLSTTVSGMLSVHLGLHQLLLRTGIDGGLLFLGIRFFRPIFLPLLPMVPKGWTLLLPLPLSMTGVYLILLTAPHDTDRYLQPSTQLLTYLFSLFVILTYGAFFYFFKVLKLHCEMTIDNTVLNAHLDILEQQIEITNKIEAKKRILRHDLRHYIRILSDCLNAGNTDEARNVLRTMQALFQDAWKDSPGEEDSL